LHRNQWVSSESRFIDPEIWDQNVSSMLRPDPTGSLFIRGDASVKHDSTALVAVKYTAGASDPLTLATHKIWIPSPGNPMDFEATLSFTLGGWSPIKPASVRSWSIHSRCTDFSSCWSKPAYRSSPSRRVSRISPWRPNRSTRP
jgi:hypothetical protein